METRFPRLFLTLVGPASPLADPTEPLRQALTEQVNRGGRGSLIAQAQLKGLVNAELRGRA